MLASTTRSRRDRRPALPRDALAAIRRRTERDAAIAYLEERRRWRSEDRRPAVRADQPARVSVQLRRRPWQNEIEDCRMPTAQRLRLPALRRDGFSRRRFLQIAGTGLVASYFADVVQPAAAPRRDGRAERLAAQHGEELHLHLPLRRAEQHRYVGPEGRRLDADATSRRRRSTAATSASRRG